ncbi:MAG: alpha/beta hydrolase, partial [Pseudomonadota bacterium]
SINQPVMLLHGENDVITNPAAARWMHQQLHDSELLMLPGCGHALFLSHPDQFIASLIQTV